MSISIACPKCDAGFRALEGIAILPYCTSCMRKYAPEFYTGDIKDTVKYKGLDKFHGHEALDRCSMIQEMIDNYLNNHSWIQANPDIRSLIEKASDNLSEAYQKIGEKTL